VVSFCTRAESNPYVKKKKLEYKSHHQESRHCCYHRKAEYVGYELSDTAVLVGSGKLTKDHRRGVVLRLVNGGTVPAVISEAPSGFLMM
jgi:hypothetical protein